MSNRLQDLIDGYPKLFRGSPPQTFSHLPAGWFAIMDQLCADLEQMLGPRASQFKWVQIKEKFGSLRAYWHLQDNHAIELDLFVGRQLAGAKPPHLPGENVQVTATPAGWRLTWVPQGQLEEAIYERVRQAEARSESTCATCGKPGELWRQEGWLYTACKQHRKPSSVRVGPSDEAGAGGGDV